MSDETISPQNLGPNAWLVDEMYEQFVADPSSVSETWREFFADYRSGPKPRPALRFLIREIEKASKEPVRRHIARELVLGRIA